MTGDNPSGEPARARTEDPKIKSLLLYQLSYGLMLLNFLHVSFPSYLGDANPLKLSVLEGLMLFYFTHQGLGIVMWTLKSFKKVPIYRIVVFAPMSEK